MRSVEPTRRYRGRLGRDVQSKLGKTLQAYFDDVVKEGVPDRFEKLLRQFDERKELLNKFDERKDKETD